MRKKGGARSGESRESDDTIGWFACRTRIHSAERDPLALVGAAPHGPPVHHWRIKTVDLQTLCNFACNFACNLYSCWERSTRICSSSILHAIGTPFCCSVDLALNLAGTWKTFLLDGMQHNTLAGRNHDPKFDSTSKQYMLDNNESSRMGGVWDQKGDCFNIKRKDCTSNRTCSTLTPDLIASSRLLANTALI